MPTCTLRTLLPAALLLAAGCPGISSPDPEPVPEDGVEWRPGGFIEEGPEQVCDSPLDGPFHYEREELERGLTLAAPPEPDPEDPFRVPRRSVVAEDLDDDGDVDLLIARSDGLPVVHLNDGTGHFESLDLFPPVAGDPEETGEGSEVDLFGLVDLNGDRLPDLVGNWVHDGLYTAYNLGGGSFSPIATVALGPFEAEEVEAAAIAFADVEGDGDLDVLLVTSHLGDEDSSTEPDQVFRNDNGVLSYWFSVSQADGLGVPSQAATFTDRDGDGDADLLILTNAEAGGLGSGFWQNRGTTPGEPPSFVERSQEWTADLHLIAMGIDSADLNGDGWLDYCATDIGPPLCLLSQQGAGYVEGAAALGLVPPEAPPDRPRTVGWSIEFADVDNDGWLDVLHASGYDRWSLELGLLEWPDLLWKGSAEGFELADVGFDDPAPHYGLAAADLDGDGWLEVVTAGAPNPPALYRTGCRAGNWIRIELRGPPGNSQGIGARVEVVTTHGTVIREVLGVRASGQSPSSVHVGLGSQDLVPSVIVRWPDGYVTEATDLPARRVLTAVHPEG